MDIIIFKSFVKRKNSTMQPNLSTGVHKDVKLKGATSLRNPTFILSDLDWTTETSNYVWWNNRYYFVDDITYLGDNTYSMNCSIDVLATYKTQIGDYTCFVERSASTYNNMIHDPLVSGRQVVESRTTVSTNTTDYMNNTGCYLVQTTSAVGSTASTSGICTYVCDKDDVKALLNYCWDPNNADFANIIVDEAVKAVFNPADYIISIKWLPIKNKVKFATGQDVAYPVNIKLGWFTTSATGYLVTKQAYGMVFQIGRPSAYYPDFRNNDPNFTKIDLWLPGVGLVNVDPIYNSTDLYAMYYVDCITGSANVYLRSGTNDANHMIASYQAQLSADVKISQTSMDVQGITSDVINAGVGYITKNYAQMIGAVIDVIPTITQPTTNTIGSQGNIASITAYMDIYITVTNWGSCGLPTSTCGRPLFRDQQIKTMSGYIKCGNASISLPGQDADRTEVNNYLNGGFYYE